MVLAPSDSLVRTQACRVAFDVLKCARGGRDRVAPAGRDLAAAEAVFTGESAGLVLTGRGHR